MAWCSESWPFFFYKLKLVRKPNAMGEDQNIQFKENLVPWLPEILEKSQDWYVFFSGTVVFGGFWFLGKVVQKKTRGIPPGF